MGLSVTYPNGQKLTSSALPVPTINSALQQMTLGMLGMAVSPDSPYVRTAWPSQGAPFQEIQDDICYLECTLRDEPYTKLRNMVLLPGGDVYINEQWNYTRDWLIHWCLYGPNAVDRARAINSALFQEYFREQLAAINLFPVSSYPNVVRAPELINGQWWERADFDAEMYEFVTETIQTNTVVSAAVLIEGAAGELQQINVGK